MGSQPQTMDRFKIYAKVLMKMLLFLFLCLRFEDSIAGATIVTVSEAVKIWETLQIVDARSSEEYIAGHLPGAVHMDWREFREKRLTLRERLLGVTDGKVLEIPFEIEKQLSALGLRDDLPVLVYGGKSRWGEEGRIGWNLLYWGARDVRLLDGGWESWVKARPNVSKKVFPKKKFSAKLASGRRIEFSEVKLLVQQRKTLVDVRSADEIRFGQITNATHLLDSNLYKNEGGYPSRNELLELIPETEKVEAAYCAGGVRSALAAFLIEARIGKVIRNYDGSMWEWSRKSSR